jgi:hypothetical protein
MVDVIVPPDTFRRYLKRPREHGRNRKAKCQQANHNRHHPRRCTEIRQHKVSHLGDQPGSNQVCRKQVENVTAFQFSD